MKLSLADQDKYINKIEKRLDSIMVSDKFSNDSKDLAAIFRKELQSNLEQKITLTDDITTKNEIKELNKDLANAEPQSILKKSNLKITPDFKDNSSLRQLAEKREELTNQLAEKYTEKRSIKNKKKRRAFKENVIKLSRQELADIANKELALEKQELASKNPERKIRFADDVTTKNEIKEERDGKQQSILKKGDFKKTPDFKENPTLRQLAKERKDLTNQYLEKNQEMENTKNSSKRETLDRECEQLRQEIADISNKELALEKQELASKNPERKIRFENEK